MKKQAHNRLTLALALSLFFFCRSVFSFCEVIPQDIDQARELLWDEIIDTVCFNAAEALFLNPVDPLSEGWGRLESVGFDLANDELPTHRELAANGANLSRLFGRYPLLSQYENFIFIPQRSLRRTPIRSTLSVLARRTHGDDQQFFSVSSTTRIDDFLQISFQIREQDSRQYLQNRAVLYDFGNEYFSGFFNVGNLTSPSNELLFGRYATGARTEGIDNLFFASRGGFNGVITQAGTQNLGGKGYFHIKEDEYFAGGGVYVQPKFFRLESVIIHGEKGENEETLFQIRGVFTNIGLSVANAVSQNSGKNATLVRYERSARNLRIISQTYLLQEGFNSPFSSLIPRNDTLALQKFGSRLSLSGRTRTQRFSLSTRYLLNGDLGTASIVGQYNFPEITGLGLRSNFRINSEEEKLRQTHTVFNQKRIGPLRTNASLANSYAQDGWSHSIFNAGITGFLPNSQQAHCGYSRRIRNGRSSQETLFFSYRAASSNRNTRSLSVDVPLFETARGVRFYGEMRFVFPFRDNFSRL